MLASYDDRAGPTWKGSERMPARQAYSHSASVGKRYTRPACRSPGSSDRRVQKAVASSHDTFSTGKREVSMPWTRPLPSPEEEKWLGWELVKRWYCSWVT